MEAPRPRWILHPGQGELASSTVLAFRVWGLGFRVQPWGVTSVKVLRGFRV